VLEIQRQQFRAWANREAAYGAMLKTAEGVKYLNADAELQQANSAFQTKEQELQQRLNCPNCRLTGDDLAFAPQVLPRITVPR